MLILQSPTENSQLHFLNQLTLKITFFIPRYFGFCFGVKNAIEICYKVINENPKKTIYLLSEMIHNPNVNKDLDESIIRKFKDFFKSDNK